MLIPSRIRERIVKCFADYIPEHSRELFRSMAMSLEDATGIGSQVLMDMLEEHGAKEKALATGLMCFGKPQGYEQRGICIDEPLIVIGTMPLCYNHAFVGNYLGEPRVHETVLTAGLAEQERCLKLLKQLDRHDSPIQQANNLHHAILWHYVSVARLGEIVANLPPAS